jgi:predicted HicB family RNase H-like nuclease
MRENKSSISKAKSYKEMGEFWDTHDLSEFWDKTREEQFEVNVASEVTYYALDKALSERLQKVAKKRGISTNTLINLWVQEQLQKQEV